MKFCILHICGISIDIKISLISHCGDAMALLGLVSLSRMAFPTFCCDILLYRFTLMFFIDLF